MSDTQETTETMPTIEPVLITLTDPSGREVRLEVHPDIATSIFEYGAGPLLYPRDVGPNDPDSHGDTFALARQRILNAIHELQAAATSHIIMTKMEQPMSHARHIAEQQAILLFNMLGQAGLMEARVAERQREMQEMAEEKSIHLPYGVSAE